MKLKKRKKSRRMRGTRLHGWAAKKHKGSGNRGGKGMAGTGKRADQRKTYVLKYMFPYFGKKGFTSRKTKKIKTRKINLRDIQENIEKYGKKASGERAYEIGLPGYKVLGDGEIKDALIIKASSFSESAKKKIEKAGGKFLLFGGEGKHADKKNQNPKREKREKEESKEKK